MTMNEPRLNLPELTVSELSAALKRTIEDSYGYVRVRGELGKVSYHANGHVYFDLKDERACIAGVIWRSAAPRIKLKLEAGLEVVISGRLTTSEAGALGTPALALMTVPPESSCCTSGALGGTRR